MGSKRAWGPACCRCNPPCQRASIQFLRNTAQCISSCFIADKDAQGTVNWLQMGEMKIAKSESKATNTVITFLFWLIKEGGDEQ